MKKRNLLSIIIGLSLVSFNYSLAYFSNELLLEDNTISIGEFEILEDKELEDINNEESLKNIDEDFNNDDEIIDEDLKNNNEQKNLDEILEDETIIEHIKENENSELEIDEVNNINQENILSK